MLLNYGVGEDSWESLGLQGNPTSPSWRIQILGVHWKDWWWSWNSNTLATWCKELTHWKRSWCWRRLRLRGEGDDRGWDGWMASLTQWTWVWVKSGSWWWTGRPGMLQSMRLQRVGHNWATELNWTDIWARQRNFLSLMFSIVMSTTGSLLESKKHHRWDTQASASHIEMLKILFFSLPYVFLPILALQKSC